MSTQLLTSLDFGKLELLNTRLQNLAVAPASPVVGQFFFNTTSKKLTVLEDTGVWKEMGTGFGSLTDLTMNQPAAGLTLTNNGVNQHILATYTFALANDLLALENLSTTGYAKRVGNDTWSSMASVPWADVTTPTTISGYAISAPDVTGQALTNYIVGGNTVLAAGDTILSGLQKIQGQINARSTTLTQPSNGFSITNTGVVQTGAPTFTFALTNDLAALEGLASIGYAVRTGTDTWAQRTLTGTANQVSITNGDGTSANPTFSLPQNIHAAATPTFAGITITGAAVANSDAVRKDYVDNLLQGIKWKNSVRVATVVAGTLASSFANGSGVDGVTLVTGDRILIKDQVTQAENGFYIVNATGSPTRALDADTWTELPAASVMVEIGTQNADTSWVCAVDQGGTIGTTAAPFSQMPSALTVTAGNGLSKNSNALDVNVDAASLQITSDILSVKPLGILNAHIANATIDLPTKVTGLLAVANGGTNASTAAGARANLAAAINGANGDITSLSGLTTALSVAQGGTGATTPAGARTNLGACTKFVASFGDGTKVDWSGANGIAHGLATADVELRFFVAATGQTVWVDSSVTSTMINFVLPSAPTLNQYRVVAIG